MLAIVALARSVARPARRRATVLLCGQRGTTSAPASRQRESSGPASRQRESSSSSRERRAPCVGLRPGSACPYRRPCIFTRSARSPTHDPLASSSHPQSTRTCLDPPFATARCQRKCTQRLAGGGRVASALGGWAEERAACSAAVALARVPPVSASRARTAGALLRVASRSGGYMTRRKPCVLVILRASRHGLPFPQGVHRRPRGSLRAQRSRGPRGSLLSRQRLSSPETQSSPKSVSQSVTHKETATSLHAPAAWLYVATHDPISAKGCRLLSFLALACYI